MKTIQKRWLPLFLLAAVTFLFPACEGNNPDEDLEGVITAKLRNDHSNDISIIEEGINCYLEMDEANNLRVLIWQYQSRWIGEGCAIVDIGKKKLSQKISLPTKGWVGEVAAIPGHGYVVRHDSSGRYARVYVKDYMYSTSGGIIGAEVQYCEWTPEQ